MKRFHLQPVKRNLGAKERYFELVNFVGIYVPGQPTIALAFLRWFQRRLDPYGYVLSRNYESL